jgi:hypothetical protein
MNKSAFLKLIQQVSNISDQQTEELERVAATFPYCQTAHLLLAKSAYDKGSMLSTQRLRRASSYATDRQLLKRTIYTSPAPEPEFEAEETLTIVKDENLVAAIPEPANKDTTVTAQEEAQVREAQNLDEIYAASGTAEEPLTVDKALTDAEQDAVGEQDEVEEQLDSELALLFTFNSISTSSTDLLRRKNQPEEDIANSAPEESGNYPAAAEALAEIDEAEAAKEAFAEETDLIKAETPWAEKEATVEDELEIFEEEEAVISPSAPEVAEINYSTDEIDRLYNEDVLGYWMGSSRMGEVLQLKDDYTRQRPQRFHPELILEYSKTHELEKAIQTSENVLSNQLDIIDQFLKLNPRLKTMANLKLKPEPQEDLSLKSSKIKKGMASESLASIFQKQGKTKKAVKIYEQLILKYPEKKSYFAEQIEKLQNIT